MNGMLLLYEQRISGYGFYTKASTHILLRYAPQNIRYTQTLAEIFLFFFGLSPNCFKNFQISFSNVVPRRILGRDELFYRGIIWSLAVFSARQFSMFKIYFIMYGGLKNLI